MCHTRTGCEFSWRWRGWPGRSGQCRRTLSWRRPGMGSWMGRLLGSGAVGSDISVLRLPILWLSVLYLLRSGACRCPAAGRRDVCATISTTYGDELLVLLPESARLLSLCETMPEWMDEGSPFSATITMSRSDDKPYRTGAQVGVSKGTAIVDMRFLLCEPRCNPDSLSEPKTPVFFIYFFS